MTKVIVNKDPLYDFETFALALDWGLKRCALEGCEGRIASIISQPNVTYGLCRKHFDELNTPGEHNVKMDHYILKGKVS